MKLLRILLRDFRGIRESEVHFAPTGVTIIEGDNEVGKSSIAEAVELLFEYHDSSTHRAVKSVGPVGRDVGPEVELELTTGPYHVVFSKRWLRNKRTELRVLAPRAEQLVGREAHERMTQILAETLDADLWKALRLLQGTTLVGPSFDLPSLARALDAVAGEAAGGAREDDVWSAVCAERDRFWTTTGQPCADRKRAAAELAAAEAEAAAGREALAAIERDVERVARLAEQAVDLARSVEDRDREVAELTAALGGLRGLQAEFEMCGTRHETAEALLSHARGEAARRSDMIEESERLASAQRAAQSAVERAAPARAVAEAELAALDAQHREAQAELTGLGDALAQATADRDLRRWEIEVAQLTERRDRVRAEQARLSSADAVLETEAVDEVAVRELEAAHLALVEADAAARVAGATVEVHSLGAEVLTIGGSATDLDAGSVTIRTVTGEEVIELPGRLRITVRASADAQALATRHEAARREFDQRCAALRVPDLDAARVAAARRADAQRTRTEAATRIQQDLRDLTLDALAQKVERLEDRIAAFLAARTAQPALPADLDAAQEHVADLDASIEITRAEAARAATAVDAARATLNSLDVADAKATERLAQARAQCEQAQRRLHAERAERSDETLAAALAAATASCAETHAMLTDAATRLRAADPEGVEARLDNAVKARQRAAEALDANHAERRDLEARIAVLGDRGLAAEADAAESQVAHLRSAHDTLERRAEAARCLYEAFAVEREAARRRYVEPFRQQIEALGRIVYGADFAVELDDELRVSRRTLHGDTLDIAQLSTGAREQLGILSRLACAAIVATGTDGGAPAVFDDALGWTDPGRLGPMGAAIAMAARETQVIVLTCTPGRYATIGEATIIRLERDPEAGQDRRWPDLRVAS